jgi:hypothetical protein
VTGFSAPWLALRAPHDLAARNPTVLAAVAAAFANHGAIAVVDLACGAGATIEAVGTRLPTRQNWRLVDDDRDLLALAARRQNTAASIFATVALDLARQLPAALAAPVDLVTASALLDLVSAEWLTSLVDEVVGRDLSLYAALTYDGRVAMTPDDPLDVAIIEAVNRHQRRDKGFGQALGPTAALAAIARFESRDYSVIGGKSDWALEPRDAAIQNELLAGWAAAASETGALAPPDVAAWLARRRAHLDAGRSSISVGHDDFFARPTDLRRAERSQSNNISPPSA